MDFQMSESQLAVQDLASQIFQGQVDDEYQRSFDDSSENWDAALWKVLGDAGLTSVTISEQFGGSGLTVLELAAVLEAQGRVLAPVPLLESACAAALLERYAEAAIIERYLGGVVQGQSHLSIALQPLLQNRLPAVSKGCLSVEVDDVAFAEQAALILLPVTVDAESALYCLEPGEHGVNLVPQQVSNRLMHSRLEISNLKLNSERLLRGSGLIETALQLACTGIAALQLGVVEEALHRTAAYVSERQQFGRPLASFQAVSHRAADGYIDCIALRASVERAAWLLAIGEDASLDARTAKWWAAEAGHRISHTAQHLHGGMGADVSYPIHRYFRWAKQLEFTLGGARQQLADTGRLLAADSGLGIVV